MSDTPRTDAHQEAMEKEEFDVELAKTYSLARILERDIAALLKLLETLVGIGHAEDCLLITRADGQCDCGLSAAQEAMTKSKP